MKKNVVRLFALFLFVGLLVGCGDKKNDNNNDTNNNNSTKTMVCTNTETDEDGYKTDNEFTIKHKGDEILSIEQISRMETDPTYIDMTYGFMQIFMTAFNGINGFNIELAKEDNKIIQTMKIDYENLDISKLQELSNSLSEQDDDGENDIEAFTKKSSLTEFKTNELTGYTCN